MSVSSHRKHFGIWKEDQYEEAPSLHDYIDVNWNPDDLAQLISYLRECALVCVIPTYDICAVCAVNMEPYGWRSDGIWLWRTSLSHYVAEHKVRLPQPMVAHFRSVDYVPIPHREFSLKDLDWPFGYPGS